MISDESLIEGSQFDIHMICLSHGG